MVNRNSRKESLRLAENIREINPILSVKIREYLEGYEKIIDIKNEVI